MRSNGGLYLKWGGFAGKKMLANVLFRELKLAIEGTKKGIFFFPMRPA
jgi:hypothetical protein